MARIKTEDLTVNEVWSVTFGLTESESGDDLRRIEMSWQNRSIEEVADNLNAFLVAAKVPLKVTRAN